MSQHLLCHQVSSPVQHYLLQFCYTVFHFECISTAQNSTVDIFVSRGHFVSLCLVWFGVIFIRHGLYQDGVFKFTVYIPDNYPDGECPVSTVYLLVGVNAFFFFKRLHLISQYHGVCAVGTGTVQLFKCKQINIQSQKKKHFTNTLFWLLLTCINRTILCLYIVECNCTFFVLCFRNQFLISQSSTLLLTLCLESLMLEELLPNGGTHTHSHSHTIEETRQSTPLSVLQCLLFPFTHFSVQHF